VVDPCAVQEHVPIWIGGRTMRSLRRAATLADGWAPFNVTLQQTREWLGRFELQPDFEVVLPPAAVLDPINEPDRTPPAPSSPIPPRTVPRSSRRFLPTPPCSIIWKTCTPLPSSIRLTVARP